MSKKLIVKPSKFIQRDFHVSSNYDTKTYSIECYEDTKKIYYVTLQVWVGEEQKEARITALDLKAILQIIKEHGFTLTEEGGEM